MKLLTSRRIALRQLIQRQDAPLLAGSVDPGFEHAGPFLRLAPEDPEAGAGVVVRGALLRGRGGGADPLGATVAVRAAHPVDDGAGVARREPAVQRWVVEERRRERVDERQGEEVVVPAVGLD